MEEASSSSSSKVATSQFKVPSISIPRKKKPPKHEVTPETPLDPSRDVESSQELTEQPKPNTPTTIPKDTTAEEQSEVVEDQQTSKDDDPSRRANETATSDKQAGNFPPVPYIVPHWSGAPTESYFLSVIKNGIVIEEISLSGKPFLVFGRLLSCDVQLEHPSLSRYHAILQYRPPDGENSDAEQSSGSAFTGNTREPGYYVYDLGSTHGTYVNKSQINPRCYCRLRVGQMVKFGGSSRMFLLESGTGGQADVEASAEEEIQEILEQREKVEKKKAESEAARERQAKERESMGAMWGMLLEDVPEETEEEHELDPEREAYYSEDPKKALWKFFDREGLELEYETVEEGPPRARVFTAKIRLPIDTATGESIYAEASVQGKKKDAVLQCALNACRVLDAHDMLRENSQKRKRRKRNWEEHDYYDSDEDTFLDRTGTIEVKRKQRMKKAGVSHDTTQTYRSLQEQLKSIKKEISEIEQKLKRNQQVSAGGGDEDLDQFMKSVRHQLDPSQKRELKQKVQSLKKEEERVSKLASIARPAEMPAKISDEAIAQTSEASKSKRAFIPPPKKVPAKTSNKPSSKEDLVARESAKMEVDPPPPQADPPHLCVDPPQSKSDTSAKTVPIKKKKRLPPVDETTNQSSEPQWPKNDEDYSDWMPPEHQTGDGKTHLNEKFGY